jgi:hypothetical protein
VPVETYFPGAILPEMLKGAEVYQTGRADYSPSGKTGRNSLNNSIILFSYLCFPRFFGEQYFKRRNRTQSRRVAESCVENSYKAAIHE